jgi:ABC-type transport system involved in cytochrome bd biosynthesis fused ATPase/permease subunit
MLGFGVDAAVVLLTPVALTVAKDVLGFLREQLAKQASKHGESLIDRVVDRLLRRGDDEPAAEPTPEPAELTDEQLDQVRDFALQKARQLKLPDAKAKLLADSLVGSLATA